MTNAVEYKTNEEHGAVRHAPEIFKMRSKNKRTWGVALGIMKYRIATSRILT
jgi:hypothetical protein